MARQERTSCNGIVRYCTPRMEAYQREILPAFPIRIIQLTGLLCLLTAWLSRSLCASEFKAGFDDDKPSWQVNHNKSQVKLIHQTRQQAVQVMGQQAEYLRFATQHKKQYVRIEHALPAARVIDDLTATVWVRSDSPAVEIALRIVFPHQTDPRTGQQLHLWFPGEMYKTVGKWEQLKCVTTAKALKDKLALLRYQFKNEQLNLEQMQVDRVLIAAGIKVGTTDFFLDELRFGPIVKPDTKPIQPVNHQADAANSQSKVEFRLDRLHVNGLPFVPRIVPYHGENLDELKSTGTNLVWVPNMYDHALLEELEKRNLHAMAMPPRPEVNHNPLQQRGAVNLVPFTEKTTPILFWYLGTRIPPEVRQELIQWSRQIENADRLYGRPLMGDFTGDFRIYSRHVAMTGISRHTMNSSFPLRRYYDWLDVNRKMARPGSFVWTWIQTEANSRNAAWRKQTGKRPLLIEPEQIRLQVYAALAAGCRGIGYWKTGPLDADIPGNLERKLMIQQLNMELQLLQPWIANGNIVGTTSIKLPDEKTDEPNQDIQATILRSDYGLLLLPIWYGDDAQYIPGQLAANDVTMVVPGANESASVWEVTTTAVRSLPRKRVAGGIQITIPKFDQTTAIVLSSDPALIAKLDHQRKQFSQQSAQTIMALARAKLNRVQEVDEKLRALNVGTAQAEALFQRAGEYLQQAQSAYENKQYHASRKSAQTVMQIMRVLQRQHWTKAVSRLSAPTSSPYTICFNTLPDYWELIQNLGRSPIKPNHNILPSGHFEDIDTMVGEGWKHDQNTSKVVHAAAELYPSAQQGKYCLRMIAVPRTGIEVPSYLDKSPVSVETPPVTVHSGQILHISGWVRVVTPPKRSFDGVMVYDSISGPAGALRFYEKTGWQRFQLVRDVQASGPVTVSFVLNGYGEILFDDVAIVPHDPRPTAQPILSPPSQKEKSSPLKFWTRLPGLGNQQAE